MFTNSIPHARSSIATLLMALVLLVPACETTTLALPTGPDDVPRPVSTEVVVTPDVATIYPGGEFTVTAFTVYSDGMKFPARNIEAVLVPSGLVQIAPTAGTSAQELKFLGREPFEKGVLSVTNHDIPSQNSTLAFVSVKPATFARLAHPREVLVDGEYRIHLVPGDTVQVGAALLDNQGCPVENGAKVITNAMAYMYAADFTIDTAKASLIQWPGCALTSRSVAGAFYEYDQADSEPDAFRGNVRVTYKFGGTEIHYDLVGHQTYEGRFEKSLAAKGIETQGELTVTESTCGGTIGAKFSFSRTLHYDKTNDVLALLTSDSTPFIEDGDATTEWRFNSPSFYPAPGYVGLERVVFEKTTFIRRDVSQILAELKAYTEIEIREEESNALFCREAASIVATGSVQLY